MKGVRLFGYVVLWDVLRTLIDIESSYDTPYSIGKKLPTTI